MWGVSLVQVFSAENFLINGFILNDLKMEKTILFFWNYYDFGAYSDA